MNTHVKACLLSSNHNQIPVSGLPMKAGAKRSLRLLAGAITFILLVSTAALAQSGNTTSRPGDGQESAYSYGYFTNLHSTPDSAFSTDAQMYVVNPGSTGGLEPGGDLCANIYVFNPSQQMVACCSCKVTPDGLRTFSVNTDLVSNPVVAIKPNSGAIKVISSRVPTSGSCDKVAGTDFTPFGTLGTWITHVHQTAPTSFSVSETHFLPGSISLEVSGQPETTKLKTFCNFIQGNTLGAGICTCGSE
jgi:hypothetical protein